MGWRDEVCKAIFKEGGDYVSERPSEPSFTVWPGNLSQLFNIPPGDFVKLQFVLGIPVVCGLSKQCQYCQQLVLTNPGHKETGSKVITPVFLLQRLMVQQDLDSLLI